MEKQSGQNTGEDIRRRTGVDPDSFAGRKPASGEVPASGTAWNDSGSETNIGQPGLGETPASGASWNDSGSATNMGQPGLGEMPASGASWNDSGSAADAGQPAKEGLRDKAGQLQEKAGHMQEKAGEVAGQAQEKADIGMQKAADGLDLAAETLRDKMNSQGGAVGSAATSAAGALEQGAQMLRSTDTEQLLDDIEAMVRQRPVESMLVAAGIGFVVSKAIR